MNSIKQEYRSLEEDYIEMSNYATQLEDIIKQAAPAKKLPERPNTNHVMPRDSV